MSRVDRGTSQAAEGAIAHGTASSLLPVTQAGGTALSLGKLLSSNRQEAAQHGTEDHSSVTKTYTRPSRVQIACWTALTVLVAFISLANFRAYQLGAHYDDARYAILAEAIAYSDTFGMINVPGDPVPERYPFVYPLLLAPIAFWFPGNFDALRFPSLVATLLNVAILFWGWKYFSRSRSYWWALSVAALYGLSPLTIDLSRRAMSEPVFLTFCLSALLLASRGARYGSGLGWALGMSATLVALVFTRTVGIVAVGTVLLYLFMVRGRLFWKQASVLALLCMAILAFIVNVTPVSWPDLLPSGYLKDGNAGLLTAMFASKAPSPDPTTLEQGDPQPTMASGVSWKTRIVDWMLIHGIKQHFGTDLRRVALPIGGGEREQAFANGIGVPYLPLLFGFLISALVLFGVIRSWRQDGGSPFLLFVPGYLAVLFLWAWNDVRLLYPIQPQIQMGLLAAVEAAILAAGTLLSSRRFPVPVTRVFLATVVIALVGVATLRSWSIYDSRVHTGDIESRTTWLRAHSAPNEILMSESPEVDFLYGRRKTVAYPWATKTPVQLREYLARHQVNYVLIAPIIEWQTAGYSPRYGALTTTLLEWMRELEKDGQVGSVYSADVDLIHVYQVRSAALLSQPPLKARPE